MDKEKTMLQNIATGDESAFRTLIEDYSDMVFAFLLKHLKQPEVAEEMVQDIFLQIWQARESLTEIHRLKPFLYVMARNYALNEIKRLMRQRKHEKNWQEMNVIGETAPMEEDIRLTILQRAVNQLPPQQQKAWILSRREGFKRTEIADQMGVSQETVKKYIQLATASIIKYISQQGFFWLFYHFIR